MATPNVGILTTAGKALIDKVNSGQAKISFSKIVFSSMDNSQLSDMQVKALTAIAPQEVVVSSPETTLDTNSGETRVRATGTNEKLADGVYVKTYGVFAKDDTGSEILYGVTVSPNPNYFPAYDGVTPQAVTYSYKTVIQETSNITMTNSNDVYASQEDLTEALQPYAKTIDVNQQLDKKVVDNKNGTEQLNGVQVQPFNKLSDSVGGRNLLIGSTDNIVHYDSAPGYTVWKSYVTQFNVGDKLNVSADITSNAGNTVLKVFLLSSTGIQVGYLSYSVSEGKTAHAFVSKTIPTGTASILVQIDNGNTPGIANICAVSHQFANTGSVVANWSPAPEDKVNVSDMRKPASDVAGIEEVNAKQDKIGYTPADDSKVAHLSGANNFDTVPTVNNNPLLLASSLPSDLARTGSDQEFTGKNTFDTAPTDKATGKPYITKDGVPKVDLSSYATNIQLATKADDSKVVHRSPDTGRATDATDFPYKDLKVDGYPVIPFVLVPDRKTALAKTAQYPNYAFMYGKELN